MNLKQLKLPESEKGQALPLIALAMVALLGMLALCIDIGIAYSERRNAQNASDAAATAATRLIAIYGIHTNDTEVRNEIDTYASAHDTIIDWASAPPQYIDGNGTNIGPVGQGLPNGARGVSVTTHISYTTFFAALPPINQPTVDVAAKASALAYQAQMPTNLGGLVPLTLPKKAIDDWYQHLIWDSQYLQSYDMGHGSFKGIVNFNMGSGPGYVAGSACSPENECVRKWCHDGFDGMIGIYNEIKDMGGDRGANVQDNLKYFLLNQDLSDDSGRDYGFLTVPVWDYFLPNGYLHICDFISVKVYVDNVRGSSIDTCEFVGTVTYDGTIDSGGWKELGPKVIKLIPPIN